MANSAMNAGVSLGTPLLGALLALLVWACQSPPEAAPHATESAPAPPQPVAVPAAQPGETHAATTAPASIAESIAAGAPPGAPPAPPAGSNEARMLQALERAVRETPFSAIVEHLRVDVVPLGADEEKHVYRARVVQSIRGPRIKTLSYFMVAERGDTPSLSKEPVILTLCKNAEGFYWPGVGAKFPRTAQTLAVIHKLQPELSDAQTVFPDCE